MTRYLQRLVILVLIGLLAGCSSATLSGSWKNPLFNEELETVYVVGLAKSETTRRIYEDRFVDGLARYGVKGIASYHNFPDATEASKEKLADRISAERADAVLISQITGKRTEEVVTPGRFSGYTYGPYYSRRDYYRPYPYYRSWDRYYDHSYSMVYDPPTVTQFEVVTIESTLYEISSGDMIWSAQIETVLDTSIKKVVDDFTETVLKDLNEQGLI